MAKQQQKKAEGDAPAITATVISEFRGRNDFDTVHEVGDDVSDWDADLLTELEGRGLVEIVRPEPPKPEEPEK